MFREWRLKLTGVAAFDTYSWPRGDANMETRRLASTSVFKAPIEILRKLRLGLQSDLLSLFVSLVSAFQMLLHLE